jgi:hypothetical protein
MQQVTGTAPVVSFGTKSRSEKFLSLLNRM